jgi:hypothetical protein
LVDYGESIDRQQDVSDRTLSPSIPGQLEIVNSDRSSRCIY